MRTITALLLATAVVLTACGSDENPTVSAPEGNGSEHDGHGHGKPSCEPPAGPVEIKAKNIVFDKDCLAVQAGQPFTIAFDNQETFPHNVAILDSHDSNVRLFTGELITGPAKTTYHVPALPAGEYHFHCDAHPQMKGDFLVK